MCYIPSLLKIKCSLSLWSLTATVLTFIILKRVTKIYLLCSKHETKNVTWEQYSEPAVIVNDGNFYLFYLTLLDTYQLLGWTWRKCLQPAIIEDPKTPLFLKWLDLAFLEGLLAEAAGINEKNIYNFPSSLAISR